jgi:hypothetical protein
MNNYILINFGLNIIKKFLTIWKIDSYFYDRKVCFMDFMKLNFQTNCRSNKGNKF